MTVKINLLPWRQERRRELQRQFYVMLFGGAFLAFLIMVFIHAQYARSIDEQNRRNAFIQQHIQKLNHQIKEIEELEQKRDALVARMQVIETLQENRVLIVRIFDEVTRLVPDGIHLTQIKRQGKQLNISGIAESNIRVSKLLRNFEESAWFEIPRLNGVEAQDNDNIEFEVTVSHKMPEQPDSLVNAGDGNGV